MYSREEKNEAKKFVALMKKVSRAHHIPKVVSSNKQNVRKKTF